MFSQVIRRGATSGAGRCVSPRLFSTSSNATNNGSMKIGSAAAMAAAGVCTLLLFGRGGAAAAAETEATSSPVAVIAAAAPVLQENVTVILGAADETINALESRIETLERAFSIVSASAKNQAFVFVKPHAVTDKVLAVVSEGLEKAGISIVSEGTLGHDVIDKKQLIDTHYGAIASKATVLKPEEQNVNEKAQEKFRKMFGEDWEAALKTGNVYNAKDACAKLGIDGAELDQKWATLTRDVNLLKIGGGHYVGKIGDMYVINGFFMAMRDKYCQAPAKIHFYVVEWNPNELSWEDFRGKVLGGTDPVEAEKGSLRKAIYENWESLGLSALPDVGDNGVHASASPFEALAERVNWTGAEIEKDLFGKAALSLGVSKETLKEWLADAQVKSAGKNTSIFDLLEDQNTDEVLNKLAKVVEGSL